VAIVGRPNVGKSTLFNAWTGRRRAIVSAQPGTTRDRVAAVATAERPSGEEVAFELVDTGGLGIVDEAAIASEVTWQIERAVEEADVLVFLLDARAGELPLDRAAADLLRRSGKPVVVAANKCETQALEAEAANFLALGLGEVIPVSAESRGNLDVLKETVAALLPEAPPPPEEEPLPRIAVVGRRNAGKSTFVNALAGESRVVVSDVPGTTRDAVDVRVELEGGGAVIVDTAGVGRRREGKSAPDVFSLSASRRSVERAEVAVVLIDCREPVGTVERELADLVNECYRPAVIVVNKWDLAEAEGADPGDFERRLAARLPGLSHAPIVFGSALNGVRVAEAARIAAELAHAARVRHPTSALNNMLRRALEERRPPSPRGRHLKVFYATQTGVTPPAVTLFVNRPRAFTKGYMQFLENRFREYWDEGRGGGGEAPVKVVLRARPRR
jgi:GTP-binding protein